MARFLARLIVLACILLPLARAASAQAPGSLTGYITDQTGLSVADVAVTASRTSPPLPARTTKDTENTPSVPGGPRRALQSLDDP
jgi:hypothetical protein